MSEDNKQDQNGSENKAQASMDLQAPPENEQPKPKKLTKAGFRARVAAEVGVPWTSNLNIKQYIFKVDGMGKLGSVKRVYSFMAAVIQTLEDLIEE